MAFLRLPANLPCPAPRRRRPRERAVRVFQRLLDRCAAQQRAGQAPRDAPPGQGGGPGHPGRAVHPRRRHAAEARQAHGPIKKGARAGAGAPHAAERRRHVWGAGTCVCRPTLGLRNPPWPLGHQYCTCHGLPAGCVALQPHVPAPLPLPHARAATGCAGPAEHVPPGAAADGREREERAVPPQVRLQRMPAEDARYQGQQVRTRAHARSAGPVWAGRRVEWGLNSVGAGNCQLLARQVVWGQVLSFPGAASVRPHSDSPAPCSHRPL